jgi:glycerol transport system ATP-binding protein
MSLELKNIEKKVGLDTFIYPTNLKLEKNTINVLLGSTLAGKTTLMQIMAGLDKPTAGEIWFNGQNVTGVKVQKRNVSMVYQQFINYPNYTVYENIASPLKITGVDANEIKERVGKVAELLKLSPMLDKKPNELSGGQQQRTALARALIKDSDLILLDEPLANLDFKLREELREELPKLFENRECIVVYATTEPSDALMIGGNTATILEGKIIQYGKTLDVYNNPENLTSAEVFSDPPMNIAKVNKSGDSCSLSEANTTWKTNKRIKDGNYTIGIRPHNVTVEKTSTNSIEIKGKVMISELSGSESLIHFKYGQSNWVSLSSGSHKINIGEEMKLYMNVDECLFFDQNNRLVSNG